MSESEQLVRGKRYNIHAGPVAQDRNCAAYVDIVIKPSVKIGQELANFLYGDGGRNEMHLDTLFQDPAGTYAHVQLRTSPKSGRMIEEIQIMLERFDQYLNETDKSDPYQMHAIRQLDPVNREATYRRLHDGTS